MSRLALASMSRLCIVYTSVEFSIAWVDVSKDQDSAKAGNSLAAAKWNGMNSTYRVVHSPRDLAEEIQRFGELAKVTSQFSRYCVML